MTWRRAPAREHSRRVQWRGVKRAGRRGERIKVTKDEPVKFAAAIERQTGADGVYDTAVPALRLSRFSAPSDLVALVYEPCLCVVAQGTKEVLLEEETYRLDPARSLLVSVDLPVAARVVEASLGRPYLAVRHALAPPVVGSPSAHGS